MGCAAIVKTFKKTWYRFCSSSSSLLAIEISTSQVKLLQLRYQANAYHLCHYARMPLPMGWVADQAIHQPQLLSHVIARLLQRLHCPTNTVITAIPTSEVMMKEIHLIGDLPTDELAIQVQIEVEKWIAKPIENVYVDYVQLGPLEKSPEYDQVWLTVAHRALIDSRIAMIEEAGVKVNIVDVEIYALQRAAEFIFTDAERQLDESIAIIDINASRILIDILHRGRLISWYEEAFSIEELIASVMQQCQLPKIFATEAIYTGKLSENLQKIVLSYCCQGVNDIINRCLQLFYATHDGNKITRAWLSGDLLTIPYLVEWFKKQCSGEITIIIANPLEKLVLDNNIPAEIMQTDASGLMIVLGLALRGMP